MTGTYDWNPMPHVVDIKCPKCGSAASFEFAEVVKIRLKKDVDGFKKNKNFEYKTFTDGCGHKWHGAVFYPGLHANSVLSIKNLPDGYSPDDWSHSKYLYRSSGGDFGTVFCSSCGTRKKHRLNWPTDAYFSALYRGEVVWAFHRESAVDLKNYINDDIRNIKKYRWCSFLLHVPTEFQKKKARESISKQLDRLLQK